MNNIHRVLSRTHSQSKDARYEPLPSGKGHTITLPGMPSYKPRPARGSTIVPRNK